MGILFLGSMVLLVSACATIDPRGDYARTRTIASIETGAADIYDPTAEERVQERTHELLQGGLTVEEAISVALLNNKGFQSLFQQIGMSRAEVVQSGLLSNPVFSFGVRFPEGGGRSELTAGLAQQIVDLWQLPIRKEIAQTQLDRTVFLVARQAHAIASSVRRSYYSLLAVQRATELTHEHSALARKSLDVAQARLDVGEAAPFEVNLARGSLLDVQVELAALQGDRDVAELALARAMGLGRSAAQWTAVGALPQPRSLDLDLSSLVARADAERLDVSSAELAISVAEDEFVRQCRSVFPSIVVGVTGERTERASMPGRDVLADTARASVASGQLTAPSIQSRAERDRARSQFIDALLGATVTMTLPLWDQNQAGIAKARFAVVQKRKQFEDLLEEIRQDVGQASSRVRTSASLATLYENEVLPNDEANAAGAKALYETGEQSILALIEAQRTLVLHRRRYVDALRNYAMALVDLEFAIGGRLPVMGDEAGDASGATHEPG